MRFYILFLLLIISCKKDIQQKAQVNKNKPLLSVVKTHESFQKVLPAFGKETEKWTALKNTELFLNRFKKASANEVLSNALELKPLVNTLKSSIKPTLFEKPSLNARINILYNECLRLADMTKIPAISSEEVHEQVDKIMVAFSSINSKINTILRKKEFVEAVDVDVSYIGLDTTKIDKVSKKSINKNLQVKSTDN